MKTSKTIFRRKALAFLGAAAVMLSAVFMASCKPNVGGSSGGGVTYKVGDIVFSDKSVVERDAYKAIAPANPPVGVVCCYTGNSPRMIALHSSDSNLRWQNTAAPVSIRSLRPSSVRRAKLEAELP